MDLSQLLDDFAILNDWEDRYRYLIELGRHLPPLADSERNPLCKVGGCLSQVWLVAEKLPDGKMSFRGQSDAHIVQGLIGVLLLAYSGKSAAEVMAVDIEGLFKELGLEQHLSPGRRNGFFSMVARIQSLAAA
jgi:cysteine desulfuration protein SufE